MAMKAFAVAATLALVAAVAVAAQVTLELKSGSTIKGELLNWDGEQATIKTEFGEFTLAKSQLSERAMVESLRRDNAALRDQLAGAVTRPAAPPVVPSIPSGAAGFAAPVSVAPAGGGYWISSTGKRHNANCRYYQTSKGRPGSPGEGVACKVCGG